MIIYRKRDLKLHESVAKRETGIFQAQPCFPGTKKLKKDKENMDTRKTVLLADANEEFRGMLREIIDQTEEFTVVGSTGDGAEALQLIEQRRPDLVLMDVQMPVMNGYEATRSIRACNHENAHSIPIIAMTANAFTEDVQNALSAGMTAHLSKPIDMDALEKTVKEVLSRKDTTI